MQRDASAFEQGTREKTILEDKESKDELTIESEDNILKSGDG
jgi:hypothetical protein